MMGPVHLVTTRDTAESRWKHQLHQVGLSALKLRPAELGSHVHSGGCFVLDAQSPPFDNDEDELLACVGLARAVGCTVVVDALGISTDSDDLVEDLCGGLVARTNAEVLRITRHLARKLDAHNESRFEFLTVSPRSNELLAIFADGTSQVLPRPLAQRDDGSEVVAIELADDASSAVIRFANGQPPMSLRATEARAQVPQPAVNGGSASSLAEPTDSLKGAQLGARLRELRTQAGLTQAELARRTGIHRPNIARVEAGKHTPSIDTLNRLASAIGVPTAQVLFAR